ncbi:MAG: aldo/keto reductase [Barnesiella intestinihominis]
MKQSDVTPDKIAKVARLRPIAEQRGQSISQLAIAWILRRKEIGSVIIGARNLDQLKTVCMQWIISSLSLSEIELIENILK